jgi:hypothetical protein
MGGFNPRRRAMTYQTYQQRITEIVGPNYDPRHVEAFMRVQYGTLDHLPKDLFETDARFCAICIDEIGTEEAEKVARSYGL